MHIYDIPNENEYSTEDVCKGSELEGKLKMLKMFFAVFSTAYANLQLGVGKPNSIKAPEFHRYFSSSSDSDFREGVSGIKDADLKNKAKEIIKLKGIDIKKGIDYIQEILKNEESQQEFLKLCFSDALTTFTGLVYCKKDFMQYVVEVIGEINSDT